MTNLDVCCNAAAYNVEHYSGTRAEAARDALEYVGVELGSACCALARLDELGREDPVARAIAGFYMIDLSSAVSGGVR